ncbi:MAG: DNA-processing protein DprA [Pseudomonadota bacterium]
MDGTPDPNFVAGALSDEDRITWLRLIRSRRVGPATFRRLLAETGSAAAGLEALPEIAAEAGVRDYRTASRSAAEAEYRAGRKLGARLLCLADPEYPALLRTAPGAPPVLWALGKTQLAHRRAIAVVGARNTSSLGLRFTRQIAADLGAAGVTVVSGLARGIDAAAHRAALPTGTVAVQAGGLDVVYPRENADLYEAIARDGLRLSELPLGVAPQARHFPQRNRIIAGLAAATLVIEGAARSGSLITAKEAADLGREVMAVPGNPLDVRAAGCNNLIRDGAALIRDATDVLDILDAMADAPPTPDITAPIGIPGDIKERILDALGPTAIEEDALLRDLGLPSGTAMSHITVLELEGRVERQPGGMIALRV